MNLRHFAVFGGIFTVIICLLLFLFIVTSDDEESGTARYDFSGLNLSEEVLKHQPTVEKYAKEYGASDYGGGFIDYVAKHGKKEMVL